MSERRVVPATLLGPTNSKIIGFDTPEQFLAYCALHCTTQRHLFNGMQLNYLQELAGYPRLDITDESWQAADAKWVMVRVGLARIRAGAVG